MAMKFSGKRPTTVAEYIHSAAKPARAKLREMRALIAAAAPGATQELKWGMPTFSYGRILVSFAAFQKHIGFFMTSATKREFEAQLA
jgi:uncharacterized protein YdhG (YjbR/CyaY superfamily)